MAQRKDHLYYSLLIVLCAICSARAFSTPSAKHGRSVRSMAVNQDEDMPKTATISRRGILHSSCFAAIMLSNFQIAHAAMDNAATPFEKVGKLSIEEAEDRLRLARKSAQYLLDNYDEICKGGGDNVRRYLGTVGTSSGLFGIQKALKVLADKADDIVEYYETSAEVEKCIQQADGSAYMAIFVTTSTSYTPPEKYFNDAKVEIKRLLSALDQIAGLVDVKY